MIVLKTRKINEGLSVSPFPGALETKLRNTKADHRYVDQPSHSFCSGCYPRSTRPHGALERFWQVAREPTGLMENPCLQHVADRWWTAKCKPISAKASQEPLHGYVAKPSGNHFGKGSQGCPGPGPPSSRFDSQNKTFLSTPEPEFRECNKSAQYRCQEYYILQIAKWPYDWSLWSPAEVGAILVPGSVGEDGNKHPTHHACFIPHNDFLPASNPIIVGVTLRMDKEMGIRSHPRSRLIGHRTKYG